MKVEGFSLAVWVLVIAFVTTLAYQSWAAPSPVKAAEQRAKLERAKAFRSEHERIVAEKIRLCAMNAPQDDCERVFRCDDDPCYCSACD